MPHIVVRIYAESGDLISKVLENVAEVRKIMLGVPGLITWGIADTGSGALSLTTCEDKAGCDESNVRAREWIKTNMPDAKIAPPRVVEGEVLYRIQNRVAEDHPQVVVRLFSDPVPERVKGGGDEIRELLIRVPGFRAAIAADTGAGGISILIADDKASADAVSEAVRNLLVNTWGLGPAPHPPEVIEATGMLRVSSEAVPA
jgi:hypothetical protein